MNPSIKKNPHDEARVPLRMQSKWIRSGLRTNYLVSCGNSPLDLLSNCYKCCRYCFKLVVDTGIDSAAAPLECLETVTPMSSILVRNHKLKNLEMIEPVRSFN